MLPGLDDFVALFCIMILALFSLPAIVVAWLVISALDPAFKHQSGFYLSLIGGLLGMVLTEIAVQFLWRKKVDRPLVMWSPKHWAAYIRIAQLTGVGCVLVVRFVLP